MGSKFGNSETETISANIVFVQNKMNPEEWTPFSWDDYKSHCTHSAGEDEHRVLNALVNGGKPVVFTSCVLEPGYLEKNDSGQYQVTSKFLETLAEFNN